MKFYSKNYPVRPTQQVMHTTPDFHAALSGHLETKGITQSEWAQHARQAQDPAYATGQGFNLFVTHCNVVDGPLTHQVPVLAVTFTNHTHAFVVPLQGTHEQDLDTALGAVRGQLDGIAASVGPRDAVFGANQAMGATALPSILSDKTGLCLVRDGLGDFATFTRESFESTLKNSCLQGPTLSRALAKFDDALCPAQDAVLDGLSSKTWHLDNSMDGSAHVGFTTDQQEPARLTFGDGVVHVHTQAPKVALRPDGLVVATSPQDTFTVHTEVPFHLPESIHPFAVPLALQAGMNPGDLLREPSNVGPFLQEQGISLEQVEMAVMLEASPVDMLAILRKDCMDEGQQLADAAHDLVDVDFTMDTDWTTGCDPTQSTSQGHASEHYLTR